MDMRLEVVVVPVSDVDRAKDFYSERLGFNVDVDQRFGDTFRVVQLTPPGSACSITLMEGMDPVVPLEGPPTTFNAFAFFQDPDGNGWAIQQGPTEEGA